MDKKEEPKNPKIIKKQPSAEDKKKMQAFLNAKDDRTPVAKISEIFNGWKNVVFPNDEVERIAKVRAAVCAQCEYNVKSRCQKCGCPLVAKTRSLQSDCPLKKWKQ
tara:strand:+ start:816 stop:1133 length:318 start_codon:yes stop_codon:yes gene_type:complete